MIYSPLINELAALPLALLRLRPADTQTEEGQTAYFCPFCKDQRTPHFIVYHTRKGGLYGTPVEHWHCTRTHRAGFGAIELYAAMKGLGYWWRKNEFSPQVFVCVGEDLRQACLGLLHLAGHSDEEIAEKWPEVLTRDYRQIAIRPQNILTFEPKTAFTPQDLAALGCTTWLDLDGIPHYGFDVDNPESNYHFNEAMIQDEFRTFAVAKVTLPAVSRKGEMVSEVLVSTPWNPILMVFTDDERQDAGTIFFPANDRIQPIVFCNTEEHTVRKVSKWLSGDTVFSKAVDYRDTDNTGVRRAIDETDPSEEVNLTRQEWTETTDDKGNRKLVLTDVEIPDKEIKARALIYCASPQDAIATYYHLKALRFNYPEKFGDRSFHVCFPFGQVPFSSVHFNKMFRFADSIYTLFPLTQKETIRARDISCRYRTMLRASLPDTFLDRAHVFAPRLFCHTSATVRDFFMVYHMLPREAYQHDNDINRLFSSCITSALTSDPLERKEKRDKNGIVKEVFYTVNPATLWEFMAGMGYARDVQQNEANKIGRFVHIDGPFADELTPESMVQATVDALKHYAKQLNDARPGLPDEYELMLQAILRANKEINKNTIASLPAVHLNYTGGYGRNIEHFFYGNGAVRITPDAIRLIAYDDIDFNVERGELMNWNVTLAKEMPFEISENPIYRERLEAIKRKREEKDETGKRKYTLRQMDLEESELQRWAETHRWIVDWKGKAEEDMWPALRMYRGFANEDWEHEQELLHDGQNLTPDEQMELDARFANLMFDLGRLLWRYRESKSNCIVYLIENVVSAQNRAEGGSGKSTFVRIGCGSCCHVLNINGRDLTSNREFSANLSGYIHHVHRVAHWEDAEANFDFGKLYNLGTGDFEVRYMYKDPVKIPLSEGPGHVVSSNFPLHDLDDSTMRRVGLGGFSHRFCGANIMKNKVARLISDIMPDFNPRDPEKLSQQTRNHLMLIGALAVQFVMRYDEKVDAQKKYVEDRVLADALTPEFLNFARVFFSQDHVFGVPIDLDSMLDEFKSDYAGASKARDDSFSPKKFKRRIIDYCETANIVMNPPQLFVNADGSVLKKAERTNYFARQAWCTVHYFEGRDWERDKSIQPKQIRELTRTDHAVYLFRPGRDDIPANNNELLRRYEDFLKEPDQAPRRDDSGKLVTLTEEESLRWRRYLDSLQRRASGAAMPQQATATTTPALQEPEDLPF